MIDFVHGTLIRKEPTLAVIEAGGLGYRISVSLTTGSRLPEAGSEITLLTHFIVREDSQQLYGFATEEERTMFQHLIAVSGIGPRLALNVLSRSTPEEFRIRITAGDALSLTRVPGIGKKTAERIIVELRDRLKVEGGLGSPALHAAAPSLHEALLALQSLGYTAVIAEKVLSSIPDAGTFDTSALIRKALQKLNEG